MAEVLSAMVVGPLVSMVKEKASSYLLEQYQVMEGLEKQHELLKRKLPAILDVIADAEDKAAAKREGPKAWLEAVRKVAYQANDVLDEFKYEALRRKAKKEGHYKELGMDVIKLFPSHNRLVFRHRMGNKLRMILQELDVLIAEMNAFRFEFRPEPPMPVSLFRENSSDTIDKTMKEIAIRSRDQDKKEVVKKLLDQASNVNLTILPIVGMGGMGKTTLAQLVYNDHEIQKHFQLRLWVCVSDNFDVDYLAKRIVEENDCQAEGNSALDKLQKAVSGKRYLLVLDDVWNRDESHKWKKLKSYLEHGGSGSSVLTTTRDHEVAKLMMGTPEGSYEVAKLGRLDDDFITEIIEKRAFNSKQEKDCRDLVGDFVKRCAGSPLAATALGSLLSTKTTRSEWEGILRRTKICDEKNGILPVLKLSYNCLPSHMRQCFAFCAMFPKDREIDVETLIQLWMANGFIPEQEGVHPELCGKDIFIELASRSFFQDVKGTPFKFTDIEGSRVTCKIHDLMHDVALDSMGKECVTIDTEQSKRRDFPRSVRHLLLSIYEPETFLNASLEKSFAVIQTLICEEAAYEDIQHLSECRSVRALRIGLWNKQRASFLKPRCLRHLRYLDLSRSDIRWLPEDISILYHLQTLKLTQCRSLERLPKQMKYMTALRHLYTEGCGKLKSMPADLRYLTSLQTLTCFVAGASSGCSKVRELGQLDDLGGLLELRQLENVKFAEGKTARLGNKKKLVGLTLSWTDCYMEAGNNSDKEVLEDLEPHDRLKVLRINCYSGGTCPTWMNKLQGIVELVLDGCKNFRTLWDTSELGGEKPMFPMLEKLSIYGCISLAALPKASAFGGVETKYRSAFPALRELSLMSLETLERWEAGEGTPGEELTFPRLEKLSIHHCKSLAALPKASSVISPLFEGVETECRSSFPALRELRLVCLATLKRWEADEGTPGKELTFPRLEKLEIQNCPELTSLPEAPKLSVLEVKGVSQQILSLQAASRYMASLSTLELYGDNEQTESVAEQNSRDELVNDKEKWDHRSPLTRMILRRYGLLFSHSSAVALWTCLAQLVDLEIWWCDALVYWPEKVFQGLVSLRTLLIFGCNKLIGRSTQEASEQSAPERSGLPPCLKSLSIEYCESLVEVPNLPASLKTLRISSCSMLESMPSSANQCLLESLEIWHCRVSEVANLPPSIKTLEIVCCHNLGFLSGHLDSLQSLTIYKCSGLLKSLESLSGRLPSLESLFLSYCSSLQSLPNGPEAYSSLRKLKIESCPGIKLLPLSLQQCLDRLEWKILDARSNGWQYAIRRRLACLK